ncbi:MAG: toxin TcdB middle/N-terminal domain-containing protein, partial [Bacteroidales bacterium]|nr:toxin TcdB middle/N-terminal domain-containing protein [Bacteroidales bacterium]
MKKTVILFFATLWFFQVFSQTGTTLTGQSFTINAPVTDGTTYKASEFVNFVPGASFQATADKELHALIDPYMIFPPTTGLTGGPNPGDDGVVGTIEGQGSVGPMGNYIYTIPLKLPECIPGMTPSLSLVYNSAGGDGYMGHGWSLGGLSSISRGPSNLYYDGVVDPVDFDESDRLALDGSRLFVTSGNYWGTDAEYRFEAENGMKVVPNGGGFKVYSPDGKVSYYGSSETSKIWKPNGPAVQWFLDKVVDVFGNTIKIEYYHSSAGGEFSVVPHKILYNYNSNVANFSTAVYNVEFVYKTESPFVRYSNQTAYLYDRVIEAIVIKKGDTEVYHYDLFYGYPMAVGMTTIESIRYSAPGNEYSFNPTKLLYSNNSEILLTTQQTSGMAYSSSGNGNTADYLPGDFNGDGYTDFIRAKWYFDPVQTNARVISGWDLFINDKNGGFTLRNQPQNSNNIVSQSGWDIFGGARIFSANINGDNKTDLVVFFDYDNKDYITADWDDYDAINKVQFLIADPLEPEFQPSAVIDLPGNIQQRLIEFVFADYNGDGLDDIFLNSQDLWDHIDGPKNWQYCFLTELNNNDIGLNQINAMIGSDFNLFEDFRPINFNGDNRAELSCRDMQDTEAPMILTLNNSGTSFLNIHTGHSRWKYEYYGDYNGDGLSDLLHFIPEPEWNSQTGRWLICYGTGATFSYPEEEISFGINVKPGGHLSNSSWTYLSDVVYLVGDFNGDGMDDVMESYYDKRLSSNQQYVRKIYFSQKGFGVPQYMKSYNSSWENRAYIWQSSYASDINGDNKEDVVSTMLGELHFYYFGAGEPEGLLKEIENGFGVKEQITYSPGKSSSVYSNQLLNLYEDTKSNVFCSSMPMYVTQKRKTLSGTSLLNEEVYRYFSGMFHRKGKGFLNFDMVRTENTVNNLRTLINTKLFTDNTATYSFILPETDYQVSYLVQEGNYLSRTQIENEYFVNPDKRYRVTESRSLTKTRDPLGGFFTGTSRVHKSFDALGQLTNQVESRSAND